MNYKHGHAKRRSRTYETWRSIKKRCDYPKCKAYEFYGGLGITYCERWKDFINFLKDMGERPEGMTIDRIDPKGNYSKENCRWATAEEQAMNKKNTVWIFHDNKLMSVKAYSEETDQNERTVRYHAQKEREETGVRIDFLPDGF